MAAVGRLVETTSFQTARDRLAVSLKRTGILSDRLLRLAIDEGQIEADAAIGADQIQPASLDLRLGAVGYRVPASFLPGASARVEEKLTRLGAQRFSLEEDVVLEPGQVYVVRLEERLALKGRLSALANPKSSTGRIDLFARVITDFGGRFDWIEERYKGPLWLELAPRSFPIRVRRGSRLAQLRLKWGSPRVSDATARALQETEEVVRPVSDSGPEIHQGTISVSVDLGGDPVSGLVAYKAKSGTPPVDVDRPRSHAVADFWEAIPKSAVSPGGGLVLERDAFYILASKEPVRVPLDHAADMIAYDTLVGEFRVHYAGFFDPGFGLPNGTPAVLEVRSHEVPFIVEDGQIVGRLLYERLAEPSETPYGAERGSNYQGQRLTLSKHFRRD